MNKMNKLTKIVSMSLFLNFLPSQNLLARDAITEEVIDILNSEYPNNNDTQKDIHKESLECLSANCAQDSFSKKSKDEIYGSLLNENKNLTLRWGRGHNFSSVEKERYCRLKNNKNIQWNIADLSQELKNDKLANNHSLEHKSRKYYGASASKIFVAGALLEKFHGKISHDTLDQLVKLIQKSDNKAWGLLQCMIGHEDKSIKEISDSASLKYCQENCTHSTCKSGNNKFDQAYLLGQTKTLEFFQKNLPEKTSSLPYRKHNTKARLKNGTRDGNNISSFDTTEFIRATYQNKYEGADLLQKILHSCITADNGGNKYIPKDILMAGKTGSWNQFEHYVSILDKDNHPYAITVLSEGDNGIENMSYMVAGLYHEYILNQKDICK